MGKRYIKTYHICYRMTEENFNIELFDINEYLSIKQCFDIIANDTATNENIKEAIILPGKKYKVGKEYAKSLSEPLAG